MAFSTTKFQDNVKVSERLLSIQEIQDIWLFMQVNYSAAIFIIMNNYFDGNKLDHKNKDQEKNIIEMVKRNEVFNSLQKQFALIQMVDKDTKTNCIQAIINSYFENYVKAFILNNAEPSKKAIISLMNEYMLPEVLKSHGQILPSAPAFSEVANAPELLQADVLPAAEPMDEKEDIILSSVEKKSILNKAHENFLAMILKAAIDQAKLGKNPAKIADICAASPAFNLDYTDLTIFDQIKDVKAKKTLIQDLIGEYVNYVLLGLSMADKEVFYSLAAKPKNGFGISLFENLFQQMLSSASFPSKLINIEGASEEVMKVMRAIDIMMHVPKAVSDRMPSVRNTIAQIQTEMKNLRNGPAAKTPEASEAPKSTKTNDNFSARSRGFSSSSQPRSDEFPNIFNNIFSNPKEFKSGINSFQQQMVDIKVSMANYKKQIINYNKKTSSTFFYKIANGEKLSEIAALLTDVSKAKTITDQFGNSALHLAALCGNSALTNLLIAKGFSVNQANEQENTPLHLAVLSGDAETVKSLVDHQGDVSRKNKAGYDSFNLSMRVADQGDDKICMLLIKSNTCNLR